MRKQITRIKQLALALCLATPFVSWAVMTKGYEDFGDTAGVILWRGTEANFHESTVIDVAEDGTPGEPYAMTADNSAKSWKRFAKGQSAYTSPGKVLVYDTAGTGSGYKYNPNCTFTPISFGGMWVQTLAINDQPFSILGNNAGKRYTEFGASDKSTLFKFDASFTINRTSPTTFFGEATVDIAQDATFTAQADSNYHVVVDSAATLKLKGAGTLAVTTMDVNGTLDLSATTRPTISGNVTLAGTIVLPEGTEVSQENPFTVCSGTLSAANAYVKIGNAEAVEKLIAVSGGAITGFSDPAYEFTENYPTVVPAGQVFTFIGGETAESATVASGVTVNGTLKTRGYISLSGLTTAKESMLEVVDGTATVTASAAQSLTGDITIDAGATMVNAMTADALNYGWGVYVHVYGTLDMRSTRWTVGSNARIHLYEGGVITGVGQGSNGAIDITSSNVRVIAHGDSTISANMRVRAENIPFEATEGKTLTISGLINDGVSYGEPGSITKQNSGTLVLTTAPTFTKALKLEAGTLELGGTAASSSVTVAASAATVAASSGSTLTGELIFVSHIPSAANKALIASEAFNGAVVLTGTIASAADITGLGAEVTLRDFTGFLNKSASTSGIKVKVEGTFTQSNGWSYDADRIYLAEIKGNGTMTQSGSQAQLYEVGSIANFTGTFNLTNARIKSNNNAVLDKAQTIATLTVAKTLTVNGGSLTGNLVANDVVVTVEGTPAVGDVLVPVSGTVSVSGTVTVNGDEVAFECVTGEGIKLAASTVTVTVPNVLNATVAVTAGGEPVEISEGKVTVDIGAEVVVTYTAVSGYRLPDGVQSVYNVTADEDKTVPVSEKLVPELLVAKVRNSTTSQYDEYTSLAGALAAATDGNHNPMVTLMANVNEAEVTVDSAIMLFGNYTISSAVTIEDGGQLTVMQPTLAGTLTIADGGIYVTSGGTLATVVAEDGAAIQLTTLSTETAPLTITTLTVEGKLTVVSSYISAVLETTYKAISYVTANATIDPAATVAGVNEWSADTVVDGGNTVVTLEITAVAKVDGVYYDDAQDAVDAAVASGKQVEFIAAPGTVTLGAGETLVVKGATLPTVVLDDGLEAPYEVEHTVDAVNVLNIYTVVKYVAKVKNPVYGTTAWQPEVKYTSLADAVAAVIDNNQVGYDAGYVPLVTLLDNVTLDTRVEPNKRMNIDLNGKTITRTGTSGNGSVFDVKSGTVTIKNGTIDCTQDDTAIVANGVYAITARSGSAVTLEGLTITVDSQAGACVYPFSGATVTINSGTYKNETAEEYQYKTGWTGMAVNQANVTDKLITITGGSFWQVNPEEGDDSGLCTNFLATGRIAKLQEGYWVVQAGTWVAQITGGAKFESLGAAITAAQAGDTVKLLVNTDGVVGANANNITLDLAGCTITGGDAIKWTGTGKLTIVDSVGGGQAIGTADDGCALWVTGGSVEVQAGSFQNNSEEEATVYVNGEGATVTITGGTFRNQTQNYKWGGSDFDYYSLNVGNSRPATSIQVSGGSFSHDPAKGDDKLGSLLASGYQSTYNELTALWVVTEVPPAIDPTDPTSTQEVTVETEGKTQEQIEAAAIAASTVEIPETVATQTSVTEETYKGYFTYTVTETATEGVYEVAIAGLNEEAVFPTSEAEDLTAELADVLDVDAGAEVAITTAKPGLYYSIEAATDVGFTTDKVEGARELATTATVTPKKPAKTGTAVFYRVKVSVTPDSVTP